MAALCVSGERDWPDLPGVEFQHDVYLEIRDWTAWSAISERLTAAGADIHALQLQRRDGGFELRCRLKRVSETAARALIQALLDEGVADRGEVEHLILTAEGAR
jgi:hypothetical protein